MSASCLSLQGRLSPSDRHTQKGEGIRLYSVSSFCFIEKKKIERDKGALVAPSCTPVNYLETHSPICVPHSKRSRLGSRLGGTRNCYDF